jgi:hypothetical protein
MSKNREVQKKQLREVDKKVEDLKNEVFSKYALHDEKEPYITKEHLREFIIGIMNECGEENSWNEQDFERAYMQIDQDGCGKI